MIFQQVHGEIYDVDSKMLLKLDELEDHPRFYVRTEEKVAMNAEVQESFQDAEKLYKSFL